MTVTTAVASERPRSPRSPMRSRLLFASAMFLSSCAALLGGVTGYGPEYSEFTFTGTKVADGDPLKVCLDNPSACARAPHLNCYVDWLDPREPGKERVDCLRSAKHLGSAGGTYELSIDVQCYETVSNRTVKLDKPWTGGFEVPEPQPLRRFLAQDSMLGRFPTALAVSPAVARRVGGTSGSRSPPRPLWRCSVTGRWTRAKTTARTRSRASLTRRALSPPARLSLYGRRRSPRRLPEG